MTTRFALPVRTRYLQQEPAANPPCATRRRDRPEGVRMTALAQEEMPGDEPGAALN
jgi:hypothetical protein